MEFWGVQVKPGQTLKCEIDEGKLLHLSQASLGESKNKGLETVPIFVKFNDQKLVVGTLSQEKCAQIQYDLVFEKDFELSHSSKTTSVYFCGYKTSVQDDYPSGEEDHFDSDSEEDVQIAPNANVLGQVKVNEQGKPGAGKTNAGKEDNVAVKSKVKKSVKADQPKVEDEDDEDDDDDDDDEDYSEDESDDDEDMIGQMDDSDDEDEDDSSEDEDEATPKKAAVSGNKRPTESASKTPVPEKKAKVISPEGQKTGGSEKKTAHPATPHPVKQAGKASANSDKSKQPSPKSAGSVTCKSCSRTFISENALQAHTKAKHSGAK